MATITSMGFGSGLDINSLVSQLVSVEATPAANRINRREASFQSELSAIGMFKGALSDFRSSAFSLSLSSTFSSKTATSSNTSLFTANTSFSSIVASYEIKVKQLAQAHSLELATPVSQDARFNAGTLQISIGDKPGNDVVITEENNTLEGIAEAINNTAGTGVIATILSNGDDRQLVLKSTATGAENTINIAVTGDEGDKLSLASTFTYSGIDAGMKQLQPAEDASITINGSSTATTSSSNIFLFTSGSLSGVSLEVQSVGADAAASTAKLEIGRNTTSAIEAVQAFVGGFNELANAVKTLTSYNSNTQQSGALLGDAAVRSVNFQLRRMLSESVGSTSEFKNLSSIGIEIQRNGTLKFDSSQLKNALETDQSGVAKLFAGAEASGGAPAIEGLGNRFKGYLDSILGAQGPLNSRLTTLNRNIAGLVDDRETLNTRLQKLESRLIKQFSAMDALVGQMSNTSAFLTQQLEGMANIFNNKRR